MPEHSGLNIHLFGDIFVCPRMKTHGYCERHSPRPGKQIITPRVALSGQSTILFYLYILCIIKIQLQNVSNVYYTHDTKYIAYLGIVISPKIGTS